MRGNDTTPGFPGRELQKTLFLRRPLFAISIAFLAIFQGCDIPTDAPEWDQRWKVPAEETEFGVEELLPAGVTISPDGSTFSVQVTPISFSRTLGTLCPACELLDGLVAPKPPFTAAFQSQVELPADVEGVQVHETEIRVTARNQFSFDPLRPGGGATGTITLSLFDGHAGGALLDSEVLDGDTIGIEPGTSRSTILSFSGHLDGPLLIRVEVDSPAGDPVLLNPSDGFQVELSVPILRVAAATVQVAGREVTLAESGLDVDGLDDSVVDRILSGTLETEVRNPWKVGASFTIWIRGTGPEVTKAFSIPGGEMSTSRIGFTREELRSFLGQPDVTLGGSGIVASGAPPVTLVPGQLLTLDNVFDILIRLGGEGPQ